MMKSNFDNRGYALIIMYLLSLENPEFTQFANELAPRTTEDSCLAIAWILTRKQTFNPEGDYSKIVDFLEDNCERNNWNMEEWVISQRKVRNLV